MAIEKFQPDSDKELFIYGEKTNVEYFLGTQTSLEAAAATNKTVSVGSHSRKRFIGDTSASTVSSHSRVILVDPGAKNGNSLPGKPFVCQELEDDGSIAADSELRQFTYDGTFRDLHSVFVSSAQVNVWLISPSGKKYKVDKTGG